MPNDSSLNRYVKRAGLIVTWAASASTPLWSVFPDAPPLVPYGRPTVAAVCAVLLVVVFKWPERGRYKSHQQKRLQSALIWLVAALLLLSIYNLILRELTVLEPQSYKTRFQIGFAGADWSLTDVGRTMKHEHPLWTPEQMMLGAGAFRSDAAVELVWQPWTVWTAGLLLAITYFAMFISWIMAVAIAAKQVGGRRPHRPESTKLAQ